MKLRGFYWTWYALTLVYVVLLPYYWAYNFSVRLNVVFVETLRFFMPEIILSGLVLLGLLGLLKQVTWSVGYLLLVSVVMFPLLKFFQGSPTWNVWFISSISVAILCYLYYLNTRVRNET